MPRIPGADKALDNLLVWSRRGDWPSLSGQIMEEHFAPVDDQFQLSEEQFAEILGEVGLTMFTGFVLEDFLSARFGENRDNVIDDYLKRRGWRESVPGKRYLQALRDSVPSLYEVIDLTPGRHLVLRDLIDEGELVVEDKLASETAVRWDRFAARVITFNKKNYLTGAILEFSHDVSEDILIAFSETTNEFKQRVVAGAQTCGDTDLSNGTYSENYLLELRPRLFSSAWLGDTLQRATGDSPEVRNRDGEEIVFAKVRFPVHADPHELQRRLDEVSAFDRTDQDVSHWSWIEDGNADIGSRPGDGISIVNSQIDDAGNERRLLGSIQFEGDNLVLTTNSKERAERGCQILATRLGELVGPPLTSLEALDQLMADQPMADTGDMAPPSALLPPDVEAEAIHQYLDKHYRRSLTKSIAYFDGKTPRQAAETMEGRDRVVSWLKLLENSDGRRSSSAGQPPYDFTWIWKELGVLDDRR